MFKIEAHDGLSATKGDLCQDLDYYGRTRLLTQFRYCVRFMEQMPTWTKKLVGPTGKPLPSFIQYGQV